MIDGVPVLLIEQGRVLEHRLAEHHINVNDILEEARRAQGLRRLDDIDYAVLERSGDIAIIPRAG